MQDAVTAAAPQAGLTLGGWITMSVSLVLVWGGTLWCFAKVLKSPSDEQAPPGYGA